MLCIPLTPLALLLGAIAPSEPVSPPQDLLAALPPKSYGLVYCESLPRLREGAAQNTWYRLGRSDAGELWQELARDAMHGDAHGIHRIGELVRGTWDRLPGGALFFAGVEGAGLALATAGLEDGLEELLDLALADARVGAVRTDLEHRGLALECLAPEGAVWVRPAAQDPDADPQAREALVTESAVQRGPALIVARGAGHLFLFAGPGAASTLALAQTSIEGWSGGASPHAERFRAARAAVGGGGLEFFLDLEPWMDEARASFADARDVLDVDPVTLLGLEGETWLFGSLTPYPGDRVEARGRLNVPAAGLAARVLRTLRPMPPDLLSRVPAGAWHLSAFGWSIPAFLDLVGEVVRELRPEGPTLENALEAGKAAVGVDIRRDLLDPLSGLFLSYSVGSPQRGADEALESLMGSVFVLGLSDGARFQNGLEQVLDVAGVLDRLVASEQHGCDVYHLDEDLGPDVSPGFAFAPQGLLVSARHAQLAAALAAFLGTEGAPNLVADPRFAALQHLAQGAVAFGATELSALRPMLVPAGLPADLQDAQGEAVDPFGRLLVWSLRPSSSGLDFWLGTR